MEMSKSILTGGRSLSSDKSKCTSSSDNTHTHTHTLTQSLNHSITHSLTHMCTHVHNIHYIILCVSFLTSVDQYGSRDNPVHIVNLPQRGSWIKELWNLARFIIIAFFITTFLSSALMTHMKNGSKCSHTHTQREGQGDGEGGGGRGTHTHTHLPMKTACAKLHFINVIFQVTR